MAQCKPDVLSVTFRGWLRVRAPWHLWAYLPARNPYCPLVLRRGTCTFSLLPDCLSARLPGTLAEVEAVVIAVEQARSLEAACEELRIDIDLPGALRWVRRRVKAIHLLLITLKGLIPDYFEGCEVNLVAFLQRIGVDAHLPALREIAAPHLSFLPSPLGFKPHRPRSGEPEMVLQHPMGPDPPAALA